MIQSLHGSYNLEPRDRPAGDPRRAGAHLPHPLGALSPADSELLLTQAVCSAHLIDREELACLGITGDSLSAPHVLVGSTRNRRGCPGARVHVQSTVPAQTQLLRLRPGLYCRGPDLVSMQFAADHTLAETVALLMELMGGYSLSDLDPYGTARNTWDASEHPSGPPRCEPALEPDRLAFLAARASSSRSRVFRAAAQMALPHAASPMETILAAMLSLPKHVGGFGCCSLPGGVKLNARVDFSPDAVVISKMPYAVCDVYAPAAKSDIEYNGGYHTAEYARIHDENRNTGLSAMGIEVLVVNKEQLRSVAALESLAKHIFKRAGKQYRQTTSGYQRKQIELLNGLRRACGLPPV